MVNGTTSAMALIVASLISPPFVVAWAQGTSAHNEVGIVYYADGDSFKAIDKEAAPQSGRSNYSAKVEGAHASIRLGHDKAQIFRVCGVDPTRFKLFVFKSEGNSRTLTISRTNVLTGGSKTVVAQSEVPVVIQTSENGCFRLTPKETLGDGEFGFSPLESLEAFMFGVGDVEQSK